MHQQFLPFWQKHLGMFLDGSHNFSCHVKEKKFKGMKTISTIEKLNKTLFGHALITMYKSFVRPNLTSQIMKVAIKKIKEFNKKLLLQLQVPSQ